MKSTLAQIIREIDLREIQRKSPFSEVGEKIKNEFERWAKNNEVVASVLNGDGTFLGEYYKIYGDNSFKLLFNLTFGPAGSKKRTDDLQACIGYFGAGNTYLDKLATPIGAGSSLGLLLAALGYILTSGYNVKQREGMTRRKFISTLGFSGVGVGITFGGLSSREATNELYILSREAEYLDFIYNRTYKGLSAFIEKVK